MKNRISYKLEPGQIVLFLLDLVAWMVHDRSDSLPLFFPFFPFPTLEGFLLRGRRIRGGS